MVSSAQIYMTSLTSLTEVLEAGAVHGEVADSGAVFGTHVGNSGPVRYRQLCHARPEELDKLAHHADRA